MSLHIAKWGNSLAVRLPVRLVRQAGLTAGQSIDVQLTEQGGLLLQPIHPANKMSVRQAKGLLANVPRILQQDEEADVDFLAAIAEHDRQSKI
jgi:antitoxin component of MazEF toxin-antitoxin module